MSSAALSLNLREFSKSDLLPTVLVGLLIVFSVLAIIYICLMIMERVFRKDKETQRCPVSAPFNGTVLSVSSDNAVTAGQVVAVLQDAAGSKYELMPPISGTVQFKIQNGDAVRKDDILFWVESRDA